MKPGGPRLPREKFGAGLGQEAGSERVYLREAMVFLGDAATPSGARPS
ncbi:hypothetical protein [Streptomyces sp. WG7]